MYKASLTLANSYKNTHHFHGLLMLKHRLTHNYLHHSWYSRLVPTFPSLWIWHHKEVLPLLQDLLSGRVTFLIDVTSQCTSKTVGAQDHWINKQWKIYQYTLEAQDDWTHK